ncbi:PfkB family carbohydrate kinase [Antribacter gilvus]|uniref:PfkB family carbohydrate kinase n=1 Tax=Antribacter gilvus TaxID=2304675 RepID=UPI000F78ED9D|nr:PfkB family carbohydrate kinase [Antribacter gilvus]
MTGRPRLTVVGDLLLDRDVDGTVTRLSPDAPVPVVDVDVVRQSPGGAGLAAILAAQRADVTLVAPVADDADGQELQRQLKGVTVVALGHEGATRRKTRIRSAGQSLVRVDDGGPGTPTGLRSGRAAAGVRAALHDCDAVLVADYGGGVTRDPVLRDLLTEAAFRVPLVWDPHPRGGTPVPGAAIVTPNLAEAQQAAVTLPDGADADAAGAGALAALLVRAWSAHAVAITAGERGAFLAVGRGAGEHVPAAAGPGGDPCGAGDRFAVTVTDRLARGDAPGAAVHEAVVAASAWVASGGAEGFRRGLEERRSSPSEASAPGGTPGGPRSGRPGGRPSLAELGARLRASGGVLVATGGCFDLLHAGHVATLEAARRLGDHLVVLVNSDRSVRQLKGPGRPLVPASDRVRVLEALDCVEAAVVFDEEDPSRALAELRPDVWAKGGDYTVADLPESAVVRENGGRIVVLPYLPGRSTTQLVDRARDSAHPASGAELVGQVRAPSHTEPRQGPVTGSFRRPHFDPPTERTSA